MEKSQNDFNSTEQSKPDQGAIKAPMWKNSSFLIFLAGQSLSELGNAFALIAMPLLVLEATGSVVQMGVVAGIFSGGQVFAGLFAGMLVDRLDRRKLMIACDLIRTLLYAAIPLGWWLIGPQVWLIYIVTGLGSAFGMCFEVAHMSAVPNLVDKDQIVEANSWLQTSFAIAYVVGPMLAGLVSASVGVTFAVGCDALSFLISALSLMSIRLRVTKNEQPIEANTSRNVISRGLADFGVGVRFLFGNPILCSMTIFFFVFSIIPAAGIDLFVFHLKHDLRQNDTIVGLVFCLASVGSILGGVNAPFLRRRLGSSLTWLGGIVLEGVFIAAIGPTTMLLLLVVFTMGYACFDTLMRISSISLRQQLIPDPLLGRVTSVFWLLVNIPGPLGALLTTALAGRIGAPMTLVLMGAFSVVIALLGFLTPARVFWPERQGESPDNPEAVNNSLSNL